MRRAFVPKNCNEFASSSHLTRIGIIRESIYRYLNRYPELQDDWRSKRAYTEDYFNKRSRWIDCEGNLIELTEDHIRIDKTSILLSKLADLYPDFDLINYKLSLFFSGVHFGKKSPYSKRSSNYFAIKCLAKLIKKYSIDIDIDDDWPHTLGKLIESNKRYVGIYKSLYTTDKIFKDKNLRQEFQAVFVRIYLEFRAGSAKCNYRFHPGRGSKDISENIDYNELYLRPGLHIKSSYKHLNSLRKFLGLKSYPSSYFDFSSVKFYEKEFNNSEYPKDDELIDIIRSFYSNRGPGYGDMITINIKQLEYILKRFYYGFWKNNHTVDAIDRDELTPFEELATKINNWKECNCHVTF